MEANIFSNVNSQYLHQLLFKPNVAR